MSLSSATVPGHLWMEFTHSKLLVVLTLNFDKGLCLGKEICDKVNHAFAAIVPGGKLIDFHPENGTLDLRLSVGQALLVKRGGELGDWIQAQFSGICHESECQVGLKDQFFKKIFYLFFGGDLISFILVEFGSRSRVEGRGGNKTEKI